MIRALRGIREAAEVKSPTYYLTMYIHRLVTLLR